MVNYIGLESPIHLTSVYWRERARHHRVNTVQLEVLLRSHTWHGELGHRASELVLDEGGSVVVLVQNHDLYNGRVLQPLSAWRQGEGFQLHKHAHTHMHTQDTNIHTSAETQ